MKILIGEISSYKAIVICKFIKRNYNDITIVTYDTKKYSKYIVTKYSDIHFRIDKKCYEDEIQSIIDKKNIDYFFPVINESLSRIWEKKHNYKSTLKYLGDIESYIILNEKDRLHKLAKDLGILVPANYEKISNAKIPYVIKPKNLSSAKGVIYVNSKDDIPQHVEENKVVVQQFIEGIGVGYSFYCKQGKILNGYGHKRLSEYPISGGSSTYREGYCNDQMFEISSKIVKSLEYTGFAMVEFKLTKNGTLYLIEINPRIWGSINQGLVNGVNYFEGILGKVNSTDKKRIIEKKTFLPPLFYLSIFKYLLSFNFMPFWTFIKNIRNNSPDVNILKDPKGYLSIVLRKFFA